jgi:hypothetical protein
VPERLAASEEGLRPMELVILAMAQASVTSVQPSA